MNKNRYPILIAGLLMTASVVIAQVGETKPAEQVERHLSSDQKFQLWSQDPKQLDSERGDRIEIRQVTGEKLETIKLKNVVPPIHFESGVAKIPPDYVDRLARILERMWYRTKLRAPFGGPADTRGY